MATERLSMRHTREILRQKLTLSRSRRAIAQSLGLSSGTVGATVLRARAAGLEWPQVEALTEDALEGRLYGAARRGREPRPALARLRRPARRAPQARRHPLPLVIAAGLVAGKQVGVFTATWLLVRTGAASLPQGVSWGHIYGVAWLTGIGFTGSSWARWCPASAASWS